MDEMSKRIGRKPDAVPSVRMRFGDLNIKPGEDEKIDALFHELNSLSKMRLKGRTVLSRLLSGEAMANISAETSGEEVMRMMREAEQAAKAFFDRYDEDKS